MRKKLALLVASLVLGLVLGELALRAWEAVEARLPRGISGSTVDLAALNYNDGTVARRKPGDELRVLSFGDSFGYCVVRYPFSYHGVAAHLLNRSPVAGPGRTVRIVNLGEPAISFYQYMAAYRHWAPLIEHDAVVFNIYLGNDLADVAYGYVADDVELNRLFGPLEHDLQTGRRRALGVPHKFPLRLLDHLLVRYHLWRGSMGPTDDTAKGPYNLALSELDEDIYYATLLTQMDNFDPERVHQLGRGYFAMAQLLRFAAELRSRGTRVLVMLAPNEAQVTQERRVELAERYRLELDRFDFRLPVFLIRESARRIDPGLAILDLHRAMECAADQGQDLYYGRDTHWSVEGNRVAGQSLARAIAFAWLGRDLAGGEELETCVLEQPPLGTAPPLTPARQGVFHALVEPLLPIATWDEAAAASALPDLAELPVASGKTRLAVGRINSMEFSTLDPTAPIPLPADATTLVMTGWTMDEAAGRPAGGLYVVVDGSTGYAAQYGLGRPDVAAALGKPELRHSGYELRIPLAEIGRGEHELTFRVLSHDHSACYDPEIHLRVLVAEPG
jgi:hypothetical protein